MDAFKTGNLISLTRTRLGLTQKQLAERLFISDKAVSKWECGAGCPDISILPELSKALGLNIEDILSGKIVLNDEDGGNMKKIKFYICSKCGNIITSTGEAAISCCGEKLTALEAAEPDAAHEISVQPVEDEYYITMRHEMTKQHYISFLAYVGSDKLLMTRLYPEQNAETRFKRIGSGYILAGCNKHGLFKIKI